MAAVDDSMVRRSPTISVLITKLKLLKPQGFGGEIYSLIVKNFGNAESTLIGASLKYQPFAVLNFLGVPISWSAKLR